MELWIRSQDKSFLSNVEDIELISDLDEKHFNLYCDKNDMPLGIYNTEQRALEVLDEINGILKLKLYSTLGAFEEVFKGYTEEELKLVLRQMAVYEMPQE